MYTPRIIHYMSIYLDPRRWSWIPNADWNWGESTHFVHSFEDTASPGEDAAGRKSKPLNREWSVDFQWLFLYWSVTFDIPIRANWEEE